MDDNFSSRVKDVITYSKEEAIRLGHDFIGTEHLLLGILRDGGGKAIKILNSLDIDLDFLRKKKLDTFSLDKMIIDEEGKTTKIDLESKDFNPEQVLIRKQRVKILRRIVDKLKPKYRDLVRLRYFKEYTYDEIAEELDLPLGTVKAQLHRSRDQLFKIMSGSKDSI